MPKSIAKSSQDLKLSLENRVKKSTPKFCQGLMLGKEKISKHNLSATMCPIALWENVAKSKE